MFYPDYTELPGMLSPEGQMIDFLKPDFSREGMGILVLYYDRIELRIILEQGKPHNAFLYFKNRNNGAIMVSKKKYNRYFCTSDVLLPLILEVRDYFKDKTYEQAQEVLKASFKAGIRPF